MCVYIVAGIMMTAGEPLKCERAARVHACGRKLRKTNCPPPPRLRGASDSGVSSQVRRLNAHVRTWAASHPISAITKSAASHILVHEAARFYHAPHSVPGYHGPFYVPSCLVASATCLHTAVHWKNVIVALESVSNIV